jgi:DNA repair protein RecO (recombination protein O)
MTPSRTPAIVLKVMDHGESDKIVVFYSAVDGRQISIAKGAKRSNKRFVNKLEPFSWLEISYGRRHPNIMAQIFEADLLNPFITLRCHYDRYAAASTIIELVLSWTKDNDVDELLYTTLLWGLTNLDNGRPVLPTVLFFHLKLLGIVGYQPHLAGCIKCGSILAKGQYRFSVNRGGLVCPTCSTAASPSAPHLPLSLSTIKLLRTAQDMELERINRLRFSVASEKEAASLLKKYGEHLLQREIQSWSSVAG